MNRNLQIRNDIKANEMKGVSNPKGPDSKTNELKGN